MGLINIQGAIDQATGGISGPQSVAPAPVAPPAPSAPAPVANTFQADRLSQNTVSVPPPVKTDTANTKLGSTVAGAINPKDQIMTRMTEISDLQKTKGDVSTQNMEDEGVFEKQQAVTDLKNKYDAKDRYYEKKRRELEKNSRGMMAGGLADQLDDLDRAKNQELADIAIQYNAAQGNYKTAYDIATAKTDALFEPLKDEIESLKTQYSFIQNDLTESEKIEAQAEINRQEAELQFARQKEMAQYEQLLKQSDPLYKAQLMKAQNEANGIDPNGDQLYAGLTSSTATAVRSLVGKFGSEKQVQNFATIQEGNNFAQGIDANSKNPAEHQALIYALAKALDPDSVVREGEYATAQKYAQSWIDSYGKGVEQAIAGTGFLSSSAITNIKSVIQSKANSSTRSYQNLEEQYTDRISTLTGRDDGSKFLVDYATPIATENPTETLDAILGAGTPADVPETADNGWFKSFLNMFGL